MRAITKKINTLVKILFLTLAVALSISSCSKCKRERQAEEIITTEADVNVPVFNQDSAYGYIEKIMTFGARVPGSEAHEKCAEYLQKKLSEYSDTVILQKGQARAYNGKTLAIKNIIASFENKNPIRVLLCAHWDSRPYADKDENPENHRLPVPGANDGGSGVGVLIETARQIKTEKPDIGIDIIFFDAEDYGEYDTEDSWALGSQYWSRNPHNPNYTARYGILLDMVGASDAVFPMEGISMHYAPDIVRKVWDIASYAGYSDYFIKREAGAVTDDHYYVNKYRQIPTIDIIHYDPSSPYGFFKYWHTLKDDMTVIDRKTLKAVGQTLLEVIYREK